MASAQPPQAAVLIVTKTTNYELHGAVIEAQVEQGRMSEEALTRLTEAHVEHYATLSRLRVALARAEVVYDEVSREDERPRLRGYVAVVTVGGDGTLLSATHHVGEGEQVFGIRSSRSSVGYLCCAGDSVGEVEGVVERIVRRTGPSVEVTRVKAEVRRVGAGDLVVTTPVLNDFLYTNANPAATTRYRIDLGGRTEAQRSSGVWVATAVGSTAAILAAGGERRPLSDRLLQFRVRELYRLGHQEPTIDGGLFDPDQELLALENRCPKAMLAMDGQHGVLELGYGDTVRFLRAPSLRLARPLAPPP